MSEIIEKYDPEKIDLIRMKLEQSFKSGTPEYYEILVDEMPIVKRTNDLSMFDTIRAYMAKGFNKISFRLYGTSPKSWRHIHRSFIVNNEQNNGNNNNNLSGVDIDARINEKLKQERERWETELLKKELAETKGQLEDAEKYIEQLEDSIEVIRKEKSTLGNQWGGVASVAIEEVLKKNAQKLSDVPLLGGIAHALASGDNNTSIENNNEPDTEVTFKKKGSGENENALSEQDKHYLLILHNMEEQLDNEQLTKVMLIFEKMVNEPENITPVAELLNVKP